MTTPFIIILSLYDTVAVTDFFSKPDGLYGIRSGWRGLGGRCNAPESILPYASYSLAVPRVQYVADLFVPTQGCIV